MLQSAMLAPQTRPPHVPPEHPWVPPAMLHACPQAPQLCESVAVCVSHPLAAFESQSMKPAVHAMIAHAPPEHASVAFAVLHLLPHEPQLFVSDPVLVSHPLAALMSQSMKPEAHDMTEHADDEQASVAWLVLHALPHPLQFAESLDVLTSQPLAGFLSQSALGETQVTPQAPLTQVAIPPAAVQTCPHPPQLLVSDPVLVSHPLVGLLSQSEKPDAQPPAGTLHGEAVPGALHASVTWLVLHDVLQSPQWLGVLIAVSQPSFAMPLQSAWVGSVHTTLEQIPFTQLSIAPPAVLHAWPHPPQLFLSVFRPISHPFDAM
jgi:hypothetical protein